MNLFHARHVLPFASRVLVPNGLMAGLLCTLILFILFANAAMAKVPTAKLADKHIVKLEVASTREEIQRGLMFRTAMPEDAGMVFLFRPEQPVNFWMYHTLIPLDMVFIKDGKIVKIFDQVPPCHSENPSDCPRYPSGQGIAVTEVIELNGGYAKRHGIKEGDSVTFELH